MNPPFPDCTVQVSDCADSALINVLDGFNLQPRVTVPFDADIDPSTVNSTRAFFVELGDADVDASIAESSGAPRVIGVNQLVRDAPTHVLAVQADEQLRQHTRYAFVVTFGVLDTSGAPVQASDAFNRFRHDLNFGRTHDPGLDAYRKSILDAFAALRRSGAPQDQVAGLSVFTQSVTAVPVPAERVFHRIYSKHHRSRIRVQSEGRLTEGRGWSYAIMPDTAHEMGADPAVPEQNIDAGARYFSFLLRRHRNYRDQVKRAIAAYNAGPGNVDKYNGAPPFPETRTYVTGVMAFYKRFESPEASARMHGNRAHELADWIRRGLLTLFPAAREPSACGHSETR